MSKKRLGDLPLLSPFFWKNDSNSKSYYVGNYNEFGMLSWFDHLPNENDFINVTHFANPNLAVFVKNV